MLDDCGADLRNGSTDGSRDPRDHFTDCSADSRYHRCSHSEQAFQPTSYGGKEARITTVVAHSTPPLPRLRRWRICRCTSWARGESEEKSGPVGVTCSSLSAPCGSSCEEFASRTFTRRATRM